MQNPGLAPGFFVWMCTGAGKLRASCFDVLAEQAKVRYSFVNVTAQSRHEQAAPLNPSSTQ